MKQALISVIVTVLVVGCAGKVPTGVDLTDTDVQETQQLALRVDDAAAVIFTIAEEASALAKSLPMLPATRDEIARTVLAAIGTTEAPGPLRTARSLLTGMTSPYGLSTTAQRLVRVIEPIRIALDGSANASLRALGVVMRTPAGIVRGAAVVK